MEDNNKARPVIELQHLTLGYEDRILFNDVNIDFEMGGFTALLGRNGTGKSTLLRSIVKLITPLSGDVLIGGESIKTLTTKDIAEQISFVSTEEIKIPNLKVFDVVGLGRAPYTNWIGRLGSEDKAMVYQSLDMVGMLDFADKSVDKLSDGERQRVMISRALAQDTPIILLDEPTAFLDLPNKYEICLLLRKLAHEKNKTIIFSSHDLNISLELCDNLALIEGGNVHYGTTEMLINNDCIQSLFKNTQLFFDKKNMTIKLKIK